MFRGLLTRTTVVGRENIPKTGPYLVVINHVSHLDMVMVIAIGPVINFRYLISDRWVKRRRYGATLRMLGAIPVSMAPGAINYVAVREGLRTLQAGMVLGFAPEATIHPPGLLVGKLGAGFFSSRADIPILPVGISNTDRIMSNARRLCCTDVEVRIGEPFKLPKSELSLGRRRELEAYRHYIMSRIAALIPERYHGYYADSPALAAIQHGNDPWPVVEAMYAPAPVIHGGGTPALRAGRFGTEVPSRAG